MHKRLPILVLVILFVQFAPQSSYADVVQGDLDGNGIVDFQDFLIFAGNFGKTGDPYDPNSLARTTVYDTVKVFVQELITVAPSDDNLISGLASVDIAFPLRTSWDADADNDGLQFNFWLKDSSDNILSITEQAKSIEVTVEVSLRESQTDSLVLFETWKGQLGLFFNNSSGPKLRIEREKIEPFDSRRFNLSVKLITPKQGTFEARVTYSLMTEEPKSDFRN